MEERIRKPNPSQTPAPSWLPPTSTPSLEVAPPQALQLKPDQAPEVEREPGEKQEFSSGLERDYRKLLGMPVQAKLSVSPPDDPLEDEADRVADQVLRMPDPTTPPTPDAGSLGSGTPTQWQRLALKRLHNPQAARITKTPANRATRQAFQKLALKRLHDPDAPRITETPANRGTRRAFQQLALKRLHDPDAPRIAETPANATTRQAFQRLALKRLHPVNQPQTLPNTPFSQVLSKRCAACPATRLIGEPSHDQSHDQSHNQSLWRQAASTPTPEQTGPDLEARLDQSRGGGTPLAEPVRQFMEPRFGADFSRVRVHTDGGAVQMSRDLQAQAFTTGQDIYFGAGRYDPGSEDGKRLLAHELTHVVQQNSGVNGNQLQCQGNSDSLSETDAGDLQSHDESGPLNQFPESPESYQEYTVLWIAEFAPGQEEVLRFFNPLQGNYYQEHSDSTEGYASYNPQTRYTVGNSWPTGVYLRQRGQIQLYQPGDSVQLRSGDEILALRNPSETATLPGIPDFNQEGATSEIRLVRQQQPVPPDGRFPGITVEPLVREVVPGSKVSYTLHRTDTSPEDRYHWFVENDPVQVDQRRDQNPLEYLRTFSRKSGPGGVGIQTWQNAEWGFPGNHTVVCEVSPANQQGTIRYEYVQVVRQADAHAVELFDQLSVPEISPELYVGLLELQKAQISQQGGDTEALETAIAEARQRLEVSTDGESQSQALPLRVVLVPTEQPQPIPLQVYAKPVGDREWALIDFTDPDNIRTYTGTADRGVEGPQTAQSALNAAWEHFVADNPLPAGQLVAEPPTDLGFESGVRWNEASNGQSRWAWFSQRLSEIGLVAGLGAIALTVAPIPGSRVAAALLLVSGVAGAGAAGLNIADRLEHGSFEWDTQTALDLLDLAGSLALGVGGAITLGGRALSVTRLQSAVLISEGVDTGTELASGVILSALHYQRIQAICTDSNLSQEDKEALILAELRQAIATGGLILLGTLSAGSSSPRPNSGPGRWRSVARRDGPSLEHQARMSGQQINRVNGRAYIDEYEVNGVMFDDFQNGRLIDYKDDYSNFIDPNTGEFRTWFRGKGELIQEANRQVGAANGIPVEWYVGQDQLDAFQAALGNIPGLTVLP